MLKIKFALIIILFCFVISCSGGTPTVSIKLKSTPATGDFGSIFYGQFSTKDFTITNNYTVSVTIIQIRLIGSGLQHFAITNGGSITNIPGNAGTSLITVKCQPTVSGSISATLEITFTDPSSKQQILKVTLKTKCKAIPIFNSSVTGTPPTIDYGAIGVGTSSDFNFTVSNAGIASLEITVVAILGSADFTVISGWTGSKIAISPSATHNFTVRFSASVSTPQSADLDLTHNAANVANPYVIKLHGAGSRAQFAINITGSPAKYNYGKIFVNGSRNHTFVLTNAGLDDLIISDVGMNGVGFSVISGWSYGNPMIVPASGGTGDLVVAFRPTVLGIANATMELIHNGSNVASPFEIELEGEAVDNYTASTFSLGMTNLIAGTLVTLSDDSYSAVIPINFNFVYYGYNYSNLYICSNGYVGFGPTTSYNWFHGGPYPSTNYGGNFIALFACDLNPELGGTISYQLSGISPDQKFVIEYLNVPDRYGNGSYSGQVQLFESTNLIELNYPTLGNVFSVPAGIGLENLDETKGINYTGGAAINPMTSPPTINVRYH